MSSLGFIVINEEDIVSSLGYIKTNEGFIVSSGLSIKSVQMKSEFLIIETSKRK